MGAKERIILPLDVDSVAKARVLVNQLAPYVGCFKLGLELINTMLASVIAPATNEEAEANAREIRLLFQSLDGQVFWDGKFADIPNTVGGAAASVAKIGVKMFNVHASAGRDAVVKAVASKGSALVLGVTVLTSITPDECKSIFGAEPRGEKVLQFADMLADVSADGIICSPQELGLLKLSKLIKVTPGVRPLWAAVGDQKRVMTPGEAIKAGADYLVIGRPITQPPPEIGGPVEAANKIAEEIAEALTWRQIQKDFS